MVGGGGESRLSYAITSTLMGFSNYLRCPSEALGHLSAKIFNFPLWPSTDIFSLKNIWNLNYPYFVITCLYTQSYV